MGIGLGRGVKSGEGEASGRDESVTGDVTAESGAERAGPPGRPENTAGPSRMPRCFFYGVVPVSSFKTTGSVWHWQLGDNAIHRKKIDHLPVHLTLAFMPLDPRKKSRLGLFKTTLFYAQVKLFDANKKHKY